MLRDGLDPESIDLERDNSIAGDGPPSTSLAISAIEGQMEKDDDRPPLAAASAIEDSYEALSENDKATLSLAPSDHDVALNDVEQNDGQSSVEEQNDGESDDVAKEEDPRAALMAMLSKRAPPQTDEPKSTPPLEQSDGAAEPNDAAKEEDPRAALMAMLSKRAPSQVEEPQITPSPDEDAEENDPKSALTAMLSKRAPSTPSEQPTSTSEEDVPEDPRATLMAMISRRGSSSEAKPTTDSVAPADGAGPMTIGQMAAAAALRKTLQVKESNFDTQSAVVEAPGDLSDEDEVPIRDDPRFEKYFRMLKMVSYWRYLAPFFLPMLVSGLC